MSGCCRALVMAGGRSERMRTKHDRSHKALRRVAGRRLIEWNLDALAFFGFTDVYISANNDESELVDWIRNYPGVHLLEETEPLGTIGAARLLPEPVTDVVVVNTDNLTDLDLSALAEFHMQCEAAMTIATHEEPFQVPFGRLTIEAGLITAYEEKPRIAVPVSSGTYALNHRAVDLIHANRRTDVPELVAMLLKGNEVLAAWPHSAQWIDVNDDLALARAEEVVRLGKKPWPGWESPVTFCA
jgi:NDP-sugar pyrophosphorylase family protein